MAILETVSVADNDIIMQGAGPDKYLVEVSCHFFSGVLKSCSTRFVF